MSLSGDPRTVNATLHYLHPSERRPYLYMFEPPQGVPAQWGEVHTIPDVVVNNGRLLPKPPSLDKEGFEFHTRQTAVTDFYDEKQVRGIYYPELQQLLAAITGAEKVVIFDHTIRSLPRLQAGETGVRPPTRHVHNDYTETSAPQRVREHLPPDEAERRLMQRFLEINVWRPIRGPLQDAPLAVCDARSIAPEDHIVCDLFYPDRATETLGFNYSPAHRWYYYPQMRSDEALIFKGYDSDRNAATRFTAHTAFDDPTAPKVVLPRESIEARALVFLPPA